MKDNGDKTGNIEIMPKRIILGHIVSSLINTQIINRFCAPDNIIRQYIIITIIG
jgi:hypothetical protein